MLLERLVPPVAAGGGAQECAFAFRDVDAAAFNHADDAVQRPQGSRRADAVDECLLLADGILELLQRLALDEPLAAESLARQPVLAQIAAYLLRRSVEQTRRLGDGQQIPVLIHSEISPCHPGAGWQAGGCVVRVVVDNMVVNAGILGKGLHGTEMMA